MPQEPVLLTREGKAKVEAELAALIAKRPELADRLAKAREDAAFGEDSTLDTAQREQVLLEARIQELERVLGQAEVIEKSGRKSTETVQPGSTVTVVDQAGKQFKYTIVGSIEADPVAGRISNVSPVGKALVGKHSGDSVEVHVPAGTLSLTVKRIE